MYSIMLNAANKKTDQSLSEFQTNISVAFYAPVETEQLISHTTTAVIDTITFLQGSEGVVIPLPKPYEFHNDIHDILDGDVSKRAGNTTNNFAYLFNSASKQCHEAWAPHF